MAEKKIIAAPSILSADFSEISKGLCEIENSMAEWVHIDVMDGVFVPNITFGTKMIGDLRPKTRLCFDVHLMVVNPEKHIAGFAEAGADIITFHIEAALHAHRLSQEIRALGKKAGVSIVPSTPVSALENMLSEVELVLVMTVNPGFGGQSLIEMCVEKINTLAKIRAERKLNFLISVDGGVNTQNARRIKDAGADVLVTGSSFFNAQDKRAFVAKIQG